jgi:hypothetical protein
MTPTRIKVKRDGPRGWHWIAAANYDPAKHELVDQDAQMQPTEAEPKKRGRPRKPQQES